MEDSDDIEVEKDTVKLNKSKQSSSGLHKRANSTVVEDILDKIGIGRYQYLGYLVIGVAWLTDGCELMTISITNYVLTKVVWFRSESDIAKMGSTIFTGFFLGGVISGFISDNYGRKNPTLIYMVLMFLTCLLSAISPTFDFLLFTRGCFGLVVGMLGPTSSSMIAEITPRLNRGIVYILVSGLFSIGEILAIFMAWTLKVDEPGSENWRTFLAWSAFPALCGGLIGFRVLKESPRYMLMKNKEKGIEILKHMYKKNHGKSLDVSQKEHHGIDEWLDTSKNRKETIQIKELLKKGTMRRITIPLWIAWWVLTFTYYGIVFELPTALAAIRGEEGKKEEVGVSYDQLFIAVVAEIPGYFVALCMIEHPRLGRKLSLIISFSLSGIALIASHFCSLEMFIPFILISKFLINLAFSFIGPYTTELYPTHCRATGFGIASAASRIGGVMMPWAAFVSERVSPTAPFFLFGAACLVAAIACYFIPYDTVGKPLDNIETEEEK